VGFGRQARSSFRKPGLFRPKFQKPELPRPAPAKGEAALAVPLRTWRVLGGEGRTGTSGARQQSWNRQEAAHVRTAMEEVLDEHAKKRRACARSKAWWSKETADLRKARGQAQRERHLQPAAFRGIGTDTQKDHPEGVLAGPRRGP